MSRELNYCASSAHQITAASQIAIESLLTAPPDDAPGKSKRKELLEQCVSQLDELQRVLYAENRFSLLLIFQAMDAAGKDSTIRAVLSGVDPAGCQVTSFKRPSDTELDHDFLWRHAVCLPQRGRIGVFNRSWYEEVLAVRVHPEYLHRQRLPGGPEGLDALWKERFESINDFERHLARNGTVILKFWLNVSAEEQRQRLLDRLYEPDKHWKFDVSDLSERAHWTQYMAAYQDMLQQTSTPWAPWYAIPADSKSYMRLTVADIVVRTLQGLQLGYPKVAAEVHGRMRELIRELGGDPAR